MSSHLPNLPSTVDLNNRRKSRFFSQIQPLTPQYHTSGGMTSEQPIFLPINDPTRRSSQPAANLVNIPGIVLSPHTPENPRVYPRSPHPSAIRPAREYSPIPGPRFEHIQEEPAQDYPPVDLGPVAR
jgi:hypothetical protein